MKQATLIVYSSADIMNTVGKIDWWAIDACPERARWHAPEKYYIPYVRIMQVHSLVSSDTLVRMLKMFVTRS